MCGIVGIVDSLNGIDPYLVKQMTDTISHRGPDGEGFLFVDESGPSLYSQGEFPEKKPMYSLAHRRLSIIDLHGGGQPLCNEDETVWITFNGEIYNHLELRQELIKLGHFFQTGHSDTEVIVHAYEEWGVEGFDRLNGIFAFGLLDLKNKKLVLARDHFGVKPIYYFMLNGRIVFSSEIKAILASRDIERFLDLSALNDFLSFRYVPSPRTTFKNIFKIESGGYLEFDLRNGQVLKAGNFTQANLPVAQTKSLSQLVEEYQFYFEQAIKRQLISDVEVGALLSGGVDSSAVCAIATKHLNYPLRTYTVGFKDFPEGNELDEASEFARDLGSIHKSVVIDESNFTEVLDEVAWFMDEPTATSSAVALYYLTRVIKNDVKVVLTGQGADEPLAGYKRYWGERLYGYGLKHFRGLEPLVQKLPRMEQLKRAFASFSQPDEFERFMSVYYLFNPTQKMALLQEPLASESNLLLTKLFKEYQVEDNLGRMLYMDTRSWLPDDLLIYGDKATMINSIEARVPVLDKDLMKFIENIPSKHKLSWRFQGKFIHKKACEKWLPSFVIKRKKKGFATPIDMWFRKELGGYIKQQLLDGTFSQQLFKRHVLEEMVDKHKSGKENFQRHLFALLMLEKWAERFDVKV